MASFHLDVNFITLLMIFSNTFLFVAFRMYMKCFNCGVLCGFIKPVFLRTLNIPFRDWMRYIFIFIKNWLCRSYFSLNLTKVKYNCWYAALSVGYDGFPCILMPFGRWCDYKLSADSWFALGMCKKRENFCRSFCCCLFTYKVTSTHEGISRPKSLHLKFICFIFPPFNS